MCFRALAIVRCVTWKTPSKVGRELSGDIKYPHLSLRTAQLTPPYPHRRPLTKALFWLHTLLKFARWGGGHTQTVQNPGAEGNRRSTEHPALSPALAVGRGLGMCLNSRNCHKNHSLRQSTASVATEMVNIQSLCLLCFSPRFSWLLLNTQLLV